MESQLCCNLIATEHGRYGLSCMPEDVESMNSVWHVGVSIMLRTFIAAEHG